MRRTLVSIRVHKHTAPASRTHKPPASAAGHERARLRLLNSTVDHFGANGLTANPRSLTFNPVAWASTITLELQTGKEPATFIEKKKRITLRQNNLKWVWGFFSTAP